MQLTITVETGMAITSHPRHPAVGKEPINITLTSLPNSTDPYELFFSAYEIISTLRFEDLRATRTLVAWCDALYAPAAYTTQGQSRALLELIKNNKQLVFEIDGVDLRITLSLEYSPSELVIFIDGVDGSGKSTLVRPYVNDSRVGVTYELGSTDISTLPIYNTKKLIIDGRSKSSCPARDMHYAFAERWHSWSMLRDADKFIVSDRSWISTLFYQGIECPGLVHDIFNEGNRFTEYLYAAGKMPLYIVLTNDPYPSESPDSLENMLTEKHMLYRMAAGIPIDETTIALYSVLRHYVDLDYRVLPIHGMHGRDLKQLLETIIEGV